MVPAETGENEVAYCEGCGYAANIEKATSGIPNTAARELGPDVEKFATPGVVTIEALSTSPLQCAANRQIKTLVYIADSKPILILVRGDDQLNETKLMSRTARWWHVLPTLRIPPTWFTSRLWAPCRALWAL